MPDPITMGITAGAAASWAWDKFGKDIASKAKDVAKEKYKEFKWEGAAKKYRAKIKKLYGTMQVLGMPEPVPLSEIYVDAYVLSKQTAHQRFALEELLARAADPEIHHSAERKGCLALVREEGNLFILGKPGAGKTTFMKWVAFNSAEGNIDKVPIYVWLKEWSDSKLELMAYIAQQFEICAFPEAMPFVEKLLASGDAVVLFDGLDEVNQADGLRLKQVQAMQNFIKKYDSTQCLITCRLAANEYTFENFKYVEMADFNDEQVQQFVKNWFRNNENIRVRLIEEFAKEENRNLRELASSPLLLTLLCLSYQETLIIPQRRVEIYEEAMDALLKKWDSSRGIKRDSVYGTLSLGHKKKMFAQVAAITFEKNKYFIRKELLQKELVNYVVKVPPHEEEVDGEVLLQTIEAQHGIFTARSRDYHSFSHLTFQEYFTARYIVDNVTKGTLQRLLSHCHESRWREVFLLTTSLLDDGDEFIQAFRKQLDVFIQKHENLVELLRWATRRRDASETKGRLAQETYIYLRLQQADVRVSTLDSALDSALARVLDSVRALAFNLPLGSDLAKKHFARHRTRALAHQLKLTGFKGALDSLKTPAKDASRDEWEDFAEQQQAILIQHQDIGHPLELTDEETADVIHYLNASRLLKDCLKLATMPLEKKEDVLDSLFLPPRPS
ncbi:MAG: NACHT domain-containing protein [Acidobacteria bacterium]|nr:NACHT domain-containing protein [Acidobacteriota bacterium]